MHSHKTPDKRIKIGRCTEQTIHHKPDLWLETYAHTRAHHILGCRCRIVNENARNQNVNINKKQKKKQPETMEHNSIVWVSHEPDN